MARQNRRRLFWSIGAIIAVGMMAASALRLTEAILNRPSTLRQISALVSRHVGGPIHFSGVTISLFFKPHVTLEDVRGYLPGKIGATARQVAVYPSYMGLFSGRVPVGAVRLDTPEIYMNLPPAGTASGTRLDEAQLPAKISEAVGAVAGLLPDLRVAVDSGRFTITGTSIQGLTLEDIRVRLSIPEGRLEVACRATPWKRLWAEVGLNTDTFALNGDIRITGLDLAAAGSLLPNLVPAINGPTDGSLRLRFEGHGAHITKAAVTLTMPTLDMPMPDGVLSLGGINLSGDYEDTPTATAIRLTTLSLEHPRIDAAVSLNKIKKPSAGTPRYQVAAKAEAVDLTGVRATLDAASGRHPVVKKVLDIVRGGRANGVTFSVSGDTPAALGRFEGMRIAGRASDAVVSIPGIGLKLTDAAARFQIQEGVLTCEDASARTGNSHGDKASLILGLTKASDTFKLNAAVTAHLPDLPPILTGILAPENRRWLDAVNTLEGQAVGTLTLGDRFEDLKAAADVGIASATLGIEGLPAPVVLHSAKAMITNQALNVIRADATMGGSSVDDFSGEILFHGAAAKLRARRIALNAAEIYPWLIRLPKFGAIQGVMGAVSGMLRLEAVTWEGEFSQPQNASASLTASADPLIFTGGIFQDPLTLRFEQIVLRPNQADIAAADLRMSDARLSMSGMLGTDGGGLSRVDLNITGSMGDAVFRQLAEGGKLPPELIIRPPLNVTGLKVNWQRKQQLHLAGSLRMAKGPLVDVDASLAQEVVDIRRLRISDAVSDGSFRFRYRKMGILAGFKGTLHRSTVDQLLADNTLLLGDLKGDCTIKVPLETPEAFQLTGHLSGSELHFPDWMAAPLQVHNLRVHSEGHRVFIDSLDVSLLESRLKAAGKAGITDGMLQMALTTTADRMDLDRWIAALTSLGDNHERQSAAQAPAQKRRIQATIEVAIGEVVHGRFTWAPVEAAITLSPDSLGIVLNRAEICGITHPGRISFAEGSIDATIYPAAKGQNLNATLNCLHDRPVDLTGTFDLGGKLTVIGPPGVLTQDIGGNIHVSTSSGEIYHAEPLERIFSLLNLPGLIGRDLEKRRKKGLAYDTISADIQVGDGVVTLEKGVMKGPMMQLAFQGAISIKDQALDVTVFVVPLKSIASVASRIPFIGRILAGDLISIPVKISGTFESPAYFPLAPSAVGAKAVRLLKDIIRLPVDIIQPVLIDAGTGNAPPSPAGEK